ncbi:hypothetical protein ABI59_22855 [Acidobacteria bacterium Mor1]|nr:hypothetical protein ABI59_22855 [Acidobacteria bacterium Mor1]
MTGRARRGGGRHRSWAVLPGIAATVLLALAALGWPGAIAAGDDLPRHRSETLSNGMLVTVVEEPHAPLAEIQLWYRVGAANEWDGIRGLAHLFEHMMFGRTEDYDEGTFDGRVTAYGGYNNAYTTPDETVYLSTVPPEAVREILELEAARMTRLIVDDDELATESKIVLEELRLRLENDPFVRALITAQQQLLTEHPYGYDPAGNKDDVAGATVEECRDFYDRFYGPQNVHLVLVGPGDLEESLAGIRRIFGPVPSGGERPPEIPTLRERVRPAELELREDLPPVETAIQAYVLPEADHPDRTAIKVMLHLLGQGAVNPFREDLVVRRGKAVEAGIEIVDLRRGGALVFYAASLPYRRQKTAFRQLDRSLERMAALEWLSEERLEAAKRSMERELHRRRYYVSSQAQAVGQAAWWQGSPGHAFDELDRLQQVTREEVAEVYLRYVVDAERARLYLKPERVPLWIRLFGWLYPLVDGR